MLSVNMVPMDGALVTHSNPQSTYPEPSCQRVSTFIKPSCTVRNVGGGGSSHQIVLKVGALDVMCHVCHMVSNHKMSSF